MAGVVLLALLVLMMVGAIVFIKVDNESKKPDPTQSPEYRELELAMNKIKEIAQTFSDTNAEGGILADLILREIPVQNRKELGPHG